MHLQRIYVSDDIILFYTEGVCNSTTVTFISKLRDVNCGYDCAKNHNWSKTYLAAEMKSTAWQAPCQSLDTRTRGVRNKESRFGANGHLPKNWLGGGRQSFFFAGEVNPNSQPKSVFGFDPRQMVARGYSDPKVRPTGRYFDLPSPWSADTGQLSKATKCEEITEPSGQVVSVECFPRKISMWSFGIVVFLWCDTVCLFISYSARSEAGNCVTATRRVTARLIC